MPVANYALMLRVDHPLVSRHGPEPVTMGEVASLSERYFPAFLLLSLSILTPRPKSGAIDERITQY